MINRDKFPDVFEAFIVLTLSVKFCLFGWRIMMNVIHDIRSRFLIINLEYSGEKIFCMAGDL